MRFRQTFISRLTLLRKEPSFENTLGGAFAGRDWGLGIAGNVGGAGPGDGLLTEDMMWAANKWIEKEKSLHICVE